MISINTSVDLDELYDEMSDSDKETLIDWLKEDGFIINKKLKDSLIENFAENIFSENLVENIFSENLKKISDNYYKLSKEQKDYIEKISRFF